MYVPRLIGKCFMGVLSMFQCCFKEVVEKKVPKKFQASFNAVSGMIQGCFMEFYRGFQASVSGKLS